MPLKQSSSKQAFSKNVETEMKSGKPQDQSLAIAYNVKRKNMRKKKAQGGLIDAKDEKRTDADESKDIEMLASGGEVEIDFDSEKRANIDDQDSDVEMNMLEGKRARSGQEINAKSERRADIDDSRDGRDLDMYAEGGEIDFHDEMRANADNASDDREMDMLTDSIADSIIRKRKMMAEGGQVDLEANSREDKNNEDDMSHEALLKEQYDDSQLSPQPRDSNEHGHELSDEDAHSMVEAIRRKLRAKRG
jgi:hypothetical protein